jgi:2-polyprenyl-3-methyl-5-hydroxy-6-metoxy-1,4-benzoquinol methylase
METDETRLQQLVERMIGDLGAAMSAALVVMGDRLGLYKAMAESGPIDSAALAGRTGTNERYVREWLAGQAAAGLVTYDPANQRYALSAEQAAVLADESSPAFMPGGFQVVASVFRDQDKIAEAFRTGRGVGWHEHDPILFRGTERFFRAGYAAHLVSEWIPALDGVKEMLERGGRVADVGCGHGASTIVMARAFPNSTFCGFDYHPASIERARELAREAGVADRVDFQIASAKDYPGSYDLVTFFDCLHDMGDPAGAARHVFESLTPRGVWMLVEPFAHDRLEDNFNPIGRIFFGASTMICTPASKAQEVGLALGAQAGEKRLREVVMEGGFTRFRRAAQTPVNMIFDVRR